MNVIDYLNYYKDYTFNEYPFNDIDNILFASLIRINYDKRLKNSDRVSIKDIKIKDMDDYSYKVFNIMKDSIRYQDLYFSNYENISNNNTQFGAISIRYKKNLYVIYKGTDKSTIGWKENFELLYKDKTNAQDKALKYLKDVVTFKDKNIYLIGHSKGGNLAMYAYLNAGFGIKYRVKTIYNNDGPGFKNTIYNSVEYKKMEKKLKMFLPDCSIVGTLLNMPDNYYVVKSNQKGFKAHDMSSWQVFGTFLIKSDLTLSSKKLNSDVITIMSKYKDKEIEETIKSFFDVLEKNNVITTSDFSKLKISKKKDLLLNIKNINKDMRKVFIKLLTNFFLNIRS